MAKTTPPSKLKYAQTTDMLNVTTQYSQTNANKRRRKKKLAAMKLLREPLLDPTQKEKVNPPHQTKVKIRSNQQRRLLKKQPLQLRLRKLVRKQRLNKLSKLKLSQRKTNTVQKCLLKMKNRNGKHMLLLFQIILVNCNKNN
jgi:hypothetical protein